MPAKKKKLLVITGGSGTPAASFVPFAERAGWQVIVVSDWEHARRKLVRTKVLACVSDFPKESEAESIRQLLDSARWVIFGIAPTPDAMKYARTLGVDTVLLVGHATPGAILKSI